MIHRFGLMEHMWSRFTHSSTWGCTYQITYPGPSKPKKSGKRHNSAISISSGYWGGTIWRRSCLRPSTVYFKPLKTSQQTTLQFGMQAAQLQIRNLFSGSSALLKKSSAAHFPHFMALPLLANLKRASTISIDSTHSGHELFQPLSSVRCYRSSKTHTSRFRNSFFPQAIAALNF